MKRAIHIFAIVALGLLMLSELAWRRKQAEKEINEYLRGAERYVDMGVVLKTVVADANGTELIAGMPTLRVIREHRFGGVVDTKALRPYFSGPSKDPVTWYCSEDQEPIVIHGESDPNGQLVYGSEGGGKTRALGMWHGLRVLEHIGEHREGGQTAPTDDRLEFIRLEFAALFPASWCRHFKAADLYVFCDGTRIQLVSTYRQSSAQGSPVQGFNWSWCGRDEAQDQVEVHEDIESRGRRAKLIRGKVRFKQLATATAKDSSDWRTLRDRLIAGGWIKRVLLISRSPFVAPSFLEEKALVMSAREFKRRYGAADLPPERAVYPAWDREKNLILLPENMLAAGWTDVTARELARWGGASMLGGHDPGSLFDVTELLKAFDVPRARRPIWVVVDELTTEQTTTEQHVDELLTLIRAKGLNRLGRDGRTVVDGPHLFVRGDPYGNNDSKPDRACYTVFRNGGIRIEPAAYNEEGTGPGRVPKAAGIEVINSLFCNVRGDRHLYIAKDKQGRPAAPRLVESIEMSEKDERGKAETQPKNKKDLSHWSAALRYALWVIERPRFQQDKRAA